jgi:flavin reductase (DIM6/NTAB) family NADH-FMN oxidoreductase RutF
MVGISVRPNRFSHGLIREKGEFVVNLPQAAQAKITDYCGVVSGKDVDKFAAAGLTPVQGSQIKAPDRGMPGKPGVPGAADDWTGEP